MQYQKHLDIIYKEVMERSVRGEVASYIPELAAVDPDHFGINLSTITGEHYHVGEHTRRFSIQSISKVFALTMAMSIDEALHFERVDVEPSGDPFNSLILLENEKGIPRNPLINSGALVISDILITHLKNPKEEFLQFLKKLCGSDTIEMNQDVYDSEHATNYRNASLLNLMKSFKNITNDLDEVLDLYTFQCSIAMSCKELSQAFLIYANDGNTLDGRQIVNQIQTKRINAIMQTCGFYDEAGEFSFRVGLPGKSGVGGGIAALYPGKYAVTTWSPPLNPKGNSERGMYALERLTTLTGLSIFQP